MRKIIILLVAILLIGTIAASGCTNQIPADNNQVPEIVHNTTKVADRTVAPPYVPTPTALPTINPGWPTNHPVPTPSVPTATPTAAPTPTPKPACTHVDIIVYHPTNLPCMMCTERYATISNDMAKYPYITTSFVAVNNSTWTSGSPRITATVRETGLSKTYDASGGDVEAWAISQLTCK
jgi:hypothetical protein